VKNYLTFLSLLLAGFILAGCQQPEAATPTPFPTAATPATPAATATDTAVPPTATALPQPTNTPTPQPEPTDTVITEPTSEASEILPESEEPVLSIEQPAGGDTLIVGQEVTIEGRVQPVPEEPLLLRLTITGGEEVWRDTAVPDPDTGQWTVSAPIPAQFTGPAQLTAQLASSGEATAVLLDLAADLEEDGRFITLDTPIPGAKAVAGFAFLFEGQINQPLDDTIVLAVLAQDCQDTTTAININVPGGHFVGITILPENAATGSGCAIARTGDRDDENGREARIPITIQPPDDTNTIILQLAELTTPQFTPGQATELNGIAIHAPNNIVALRLEVDTPASGLNLITESTAVPDTFGLWTAVLDVPADAPTGEAILTITVGETGNAYREIRLVVQITG